MYWMPFRKGFFTSLLLASLCLFIGPGKCQDAEINNCPKEPVA